MSQLALIDMAPSAPPSLESDEWYTSAATDAWARSCAGVEAWDLDVAACDEAHLAAAYFTKAHDGLSQPWRAPRVWCNPPYSQISAWVEKAWLEYNAERFDVLAMLLPAVKTEQSWWHEFVEPHRDFGAAFRTHFEQGRAAFAAPGTNGQPVKGSPFGCVLLVWRRT
jgi:phage N-6-adenine-methyltransferase